MRFRRRVRTHVTFSDFITRSDKECRVYARLHDPELYELDYPQTAHQHVGFVVEQHRMSCDKLRSLTDYITEKKQTHDAKKNAEFYRWMTLAIIIITTWFVGWLFRLTFIAAQS